MEGGLYLKKTFCGRGMAIFTGTHNRSTACHVAGASLQPRLLQTVPKRCGLCMQENKQWGAK